MGLLGRIRRGGYVPDSDVASVPGRHLTLAEVAWRIEAGEERLSPVRDFLDQVSRRTDEELAGVIAEPPPMTGDEKTDALLAGIAEHLSATRGLPCPAWARDGGRFLDRFWFVSDVPEFRAVALAQTPIALERRGVFWPARSLERV